MDYTYEVTKRILPKVLQLLGRKDLSEQIESTNRKINETMASAAEALAPTLRDVKKQESEEKELSLHSFINPSSAQSFDAAMNEMEQTIQNLRASSSQRLV
jgi:hypothetical protein